MGLIPSMVNLFPSDIAPFIQNLLSADPEETLGGNKKFNLFDVVSKVCSDTGVSEISISFLFLLSARLYGGHELLYFRISVMPPYMIEDLLNRRRING
jgi:hypothetical protein